MSFGRNFIYKLLNVVAVVVVDVVKLIGVVALLETVIVCLFVDFD